MQNGRPIRVAAAGDIHASSGERDRVVAAFESLERGTDLLLLAGDLTTCGDPDEAAVLADACRGLDVPVVAVLGNHDWHLNRTQEVAAALGRGGIRVLERGSERFDLHGLDVGVVGMKGFVGGFPDYVLPDFGEPLLREVYAETTKDVECARPRAGRRSGTATCGSCSFTTHRRRRRWRGSRAGSGRSWARTGSPARSPRTRRTSFSTATRIAGTFEGYIGRVPVYNVAIQVTQRDFWYFELGPRERAHEAVDRDRRPERRAIAQRPERSSGDRARGRARGTAPAARYRAGARPRGSGIDSPAVPSSIAMQCEWPFPKSMSSGQMFSVRRSQSSCA